MTRIDGPQPGQAYEKSPTTEHTPIISVVVPAFNSAKYLAATLDCLLRQTDSSWECVVLDDGSTDATFAIAEHYASLESRFKVLQQSNRGVSAARNAGLAHSNPDAPYVLFLDADDLITPRALEILRTALNHHPEWVGAHAAAAYIDENGVLLSSPERQDVLRSRVTIKKGKPARLEPHEVTDHVSLSVGCNCLPGGTLCRKSKIYESGLFKENMRHCEDWDFFYRLSRLGPIGYVDETLLHYRQHRGSATADHVAQWKGISAFRTKVYRDPTLNRYHRRALRRAFRAEQAANFGPRFVDIWAQLKQRRILGTFSGIGRLLLTSTRFVRGYPTPND